jgi:hypothetical protein
MGLNIIQVLIVPIIVGHPTLLSECCLSGNSGVKAQAEQVEIIKVIGIVHQLMPTSVH